MAEELPPEPEWRGDLQAVMWCGSIGASVRLPPSRLSTAPPLG
jgi:hypothetical protein